MSIFQIKDKYGNWVSVPALRGPKGDSFTYEDFTPEQLAELKGEDGKTPQLTIGTVETLSASSNATATITGTPEEPKLNLGIPKGDTGVTEEQDPTVPAWAKQDNKPTYTAPEVGATGQWKLLHRIKIKEDAVTTSTYSEIGYTNTSNVAFYTPTDGVGTLFWFDKDAEGNSFSVSEIMIDAYAKANWVLDKEAARTNIVVSDSGGSVVTGATVASASADDFDASTSVTLFLASYCSIYDMNWWWAEDSIVHRHTYLPFLTSGAPQTFNRLEFSILDHPKLGFINDTSITIWGR